MISVAADIATLVALMAIDAVGGTEYALAAFEWLGSTYITSFCCK